MKKRAIEAALILAALLLLFGAVNFVMEKAESGTVTIDGGIYSTGERELSLILMTEDGLENMHRFTRLEKLKVSSYTEELIRAADESAKSEVRSMTEEIYPDCTKVEDVSFAAAIPVLRELDVSGCGVTDISCLKGMSLTSLDIGETKVSDISPLTEMDSLEILNISGIPAEDLSPILYMKGLSDVYFDTENIRNDPETARILADSGDVTFHGKDASGMVKIIADSAELAGMADNGE
ncbi:MAG: hypothetical protein NC120_07830 [Ruminococcus sp.]|nr:hypothetical protein [Ruminococcus sp.]